MLSISWSRKTDIGVYYEAVYEGLVIQVEKDRTTGYGYWQIWRGNDRVAYNHVSGGINKTKKAVIAWIEQNLERINA